MARAHWLALALIAAGVSACRDLHLQDGKLRCGPSRSCPDGFECHDDDHCYSRLSRHDAGEAGLSPPEREPAEVSAAVDAAVDLEAADNGPGEHIDSEGDAAADGAQASDLSASAGGAAGTDSARADTSGGAGSGGAGTGVPADGGAGMQGDAASTDAPAEARHLFNVLDLPGLDSWYDAAKGVTADANGNVSLWADQSGHGRNEVGGGQFRPTLVAGAANGKPAISFLDHRVKLGRQTPGDTFGSTELLVEMVISGPVTTAADNMTPGEPWLIFNTTGTTSLHGGYDIAGRHSQATVDGDTARALLGPMVTTAALPHVVGLHRTGTGATAAMDLRVDGASINNEIHPAWGQDVGADVELRGPGSIAELLVVKGAVSAADIANVESYLKIKYGL